MVLGGLKQGVTPLEIAKSYETLAQKGNVVSGSLAPYDGGPVTFTRVEGGNIDDKNKVERKRAIPESVAEQATQILSSVVTLGHGPRGPDRRVRRGQDRDDRELPGRVVRRFRRRPHGRGVGRLSRGRQADGDGVPRRAGRGRHLPCGDLARLHGQREQDPRVTLGQGREGDDRADRPDGRSRTRPSRAERGAERAAEDQAQEAGEPSSRRGRRNSARGPDRACSRSPAGADADTRAGPRPDADSAGGGGGTGGSGGSGGASGGEP